MTSTTHFRLRLFGTPELLKLTEGEELPVPLQPKQLALLAVIAVEGRSGSVRRDRIVGILWPDRSTQRARRALSQALYGLRKALGAGVLPNRGDEALVLDRRHVHCDVLEFHEMLDADRRAGALELYRGDFLDGFHVSRSPDFEQWSSSVRRDLQRTAQTAAVELAGVYEDEGRLTEAARWLRWTLDRDPTREQPLRQLMQVLVRSGERASALEAFRAQRHRLDRELGLEPDPETRELAEAIRRGDAPREPEGWRHHDPGRRRLAGRPGADSNETGPNRPSLAVLPIDEEALEPDQRYLAAALARGIRARLADFGELAVANTDLVGEPARPTTAPGPGLASELGVHYLVLVRLASANEHLQVSYRVVDAGSDDDIWHDVRDCDLADLVEVEESVAAHVAERLGARDAPAVPRKADRPGTPAAYQLHRRAQELMVAGAREHTTAVELLHQAVRLDPEYAPAYAALAEAVGLGIQYFGHSRARAESGRAAARRALDLDPVLPDAHAALALNLHHLGQLAAARRGFEQAIELRPSFARAMSHLSLTELQAGRFDEAVRWGARALPLLPGDPEIRAKIGAAEMLLLRFRQAATWLERALEIRSDYIALTAYVYLELNRAEPARAVERAQLLLDHDRDSVLGLRSMGDATLFAGNLEKAKDCYDRLYRVAPESRHPTIFTTTRLLAGYCAHVSGEAEQAAALLDEAMSRTIDELEQHHEHPGIPLERAAILAIRGEREAALDWLARAVDAGWNTAGLTEHDPLFKTVRSDPRFEQLMARMEERVATMRERLERSME